METKKFLFRTRWKSYLPSLVFLLFPLLILPSIKSFFSPNTLIGSICLALLIRFSLTNQVLPLRLLKSKDAYAGYYYHHHTTRAFAITPLFSVLYFYLVTLVIMDDPTPPLLGLVMGYTVCGMLYCGIGYISYLSFETRSLIILEDYRRLFDRQFAHALFLVLAALIEVVGILYFLQPHIEEKIEIHQVLKDPDSIFAKLVLAWLVLSVIAVGSFRFFSKQIPSSIFFLRSLPIVLLVSSCSVSISEQLLVIMEVDSYFLGFQRNVQILLFLFLAIAVSSLLFYWAGRREDPESLPLLRTPDFRGGRALSRLFLVIILIPFAISMIGLEEGGVIASLLVASIPLLSIRQKMRLDSLIAERTLELEEENSRKTQELEQARQLQLAMLPQVPPALPHIEIAWYMETATEVGGDYYDYSLAEDGTLTVALGDATGHGMQSGVVVTATKSLFQSMANTPGIVETFTAMSHSIRGLNLERLHMAMAMVKIKDYKLRISSAGIPPLLLYRADTGAVEEILVAGMPIGSSSSFPYQQEEFDLHPTDTLVLMTDGLPERLNPQEEEFGYPRTSELFSRIAELPPDEICRRLTQGGEEWAEGKPQDDDITFVVIKMK